MSELNEHHQRALHGYLRFARYQRQQRLRTVDASFCHVEESGLLEDTYTRDEVIAVLRQLAQVVRADVETELINVAHTNALLLQNVFAQAEKWHLKLNADTDNVENGELLEKIKLFEDENAKPSKQHVSSPTRCRLEPMGGTKLLRQEIDRLQEDNVRLRERLKTIESETTGYLSDRSSLSEELHKTKDAIEKQNEEYAKEVVELHERLSKALVQASGDGQEDSETKHQLLRIKAELERSEKELQKRVSEAPAYVNLKKLLMQKNTVIKDLRKKLSKYEQVSAEANDDGDVF